MNLDKPKCYCGVFGVIGSESPAIKTYYGLHSLQHRGQEAAGIVTMNTLDSGKKGFNFHKNSGLVNEVFHNKDLLGNLKGYAAIGHNRYSTTGQSSKKNIQPYMVNYKSGHLALAHNGNLTNAKELRKELVNEGAIFQTTSDTEVILHLIARSKKENQIEQIKDALSQIEGAFSIVILTDNKLIAARDRYGFKPLCLGKTNDGGFIIASETCALDINFSEYIRDINPGEILEIDKECKDINRAKSYRINKSKTTPKHCIFEYIYFSRPDSQIFGHNVDKIRRKLGKVLAKNHPVTDKDGEKVIVFSVPDSSNTCAIGYQDHLLKQGIDSKLEIGLIRSHYVGRTFILPGQQTREVGVRVKFNPVKGVIEGRTIVLVDDSIVRGTTMKQLVKLIKEAKPKAIHLRISSSPILHPCYYGMDFPSEKELIANKLSRDTEKIREYFDVDSLEYMTVDEMLEAMIDQENEHFCTACFSGKYPTEVNKTVTKEEYED